MGYIDANKDGINDLFVDADGDGINDITGLSYPHSFLFVDKDKDGLNDLWRDRDGDGVNDLAIELAKKNGDFIAPPWIDLDGDGLPDLDVTDIKIKNIRKYLLDENDDGKNDVTGLFYRQDSSLFGYRYGIVDEESNITHKKFIDVDGDGMDDRVAERRGMRRQQGQQDFFIDEDGDGISDHRGFKRVQRQGAGKRGKGRR